MIQDRDDTSPRLALSLKEKKRKQQKDLNSSTGSCCHWFWSLCHPFGTLTQCPCHVLSVCRVSGDLLDALPPNCWKGWPMGLSAVTLTFWSRGCCVTDFRRAQAPICVSRTYSITPELIYRGLLECRINVFSLVCKWRIVSKHQWCRQTRLKG